LFLPNGDHIAKFLITSALPYVDGIMHLGNLVGSVLPADVYYKYLTIKGEDAIFICGSDQHGTPIEIRAIEQGIEPEKLASELHEKTKELLERFECTFTYYGKTNSEANKEVVYEVFNALRKNGYIHEIESKVPYCGIDKRFLPDRFIEGTCPYCNGGNARGDQCDNCGHLLDPKDLINPHCKLCGNKAIVFKVVKNLALDLEKLQPKISEFVNRESKNDWSKNAVNKTLSRFEEGLKPRVITRHLKWGFPVPLRGFEETVFYVWITGLLGYIGITKEWSDKWKDYWTDRQRILVQFMGKDNIEFHTIVGPGALLGSDLGYILPHTIRASEFLSAKGVKFSKSRGVGLNIQNALDILKPDYWRFVLMYLYPETSDTDFTIALLIGIVNNIMNDKIGNLVNRVLTLTKSNSSLVKSVGISASNTYKKSIDKIIEKYEDNFKHFKLREALFNIIELADLGNRIMSTKEPWSLVKRAASDKAAASELNDLLGSLLVITRDIGILLWPFTPNASINILKHFKAGPELGNLKKDLSLDLKEPTRQIFTKVTDKEKAALERFAND